MTVARTHWHAAAESGCLAARQELSRQRVGLSSPDNSDTHDSNGERGRRGRRGRRRSYKLHICGIGGGPRAGGVTGYIVAALGEDWRRRAAAPVEDRSRRTSREPAAEVMDRRRSGQRSDSESRRRSLRTAGLGQPAGPRHSPAPTGVRRGTSDGNGWIGSRSKAVEITGSRVGRRAAIQD